MNAILFTNNNLRLRDNLTLQKAEQESEELVALFFINQAGSKKKVWDMQKIWPYRAKFLIESVQNLEKNIERLWWKLHKIVWDDITKIFDFCKEHNIEKVFVQQQFGSEEQTEMQKLSRALDSKDRKLIEVYDGTMVHLDDLPFNIQDLPDVYTHFRRAVEKAKPNMHERYEWPWENTFSSVEDFTSDKLSLEFFWFNEEEARTDSRAAIKFIGWEDEAWSRLHHYFWKTEKLAKYKETRNGLVWADYSSKFSAWLAHGCISARSIYSEVKRFESEVKKNDSTYWLIFELLWRDYFQFLFIQDNTQFFHDFPEENAKLSKEKQQKFERWQNGELWVPFVDANMLELKLTGFMSNRGRQNVASYLVKDLQVDRQRWAMHFENLLIDYDLASNWWNWAYQAWVGNDPRDNRYFNIEKQQWMYDRKWEYRKLWSN